MTAIFYLLTLILPLATILIVFRMRTLAAVQESKARQAHDDAYRQLADSAATAQSQIANSLAAIETSLTDVRTRTSAIETILRAVE